MAARRVASSFIARAGAGDATQTGMGLRQRNVANEEVANQAATSIPLDDPMRGMKIDNAQQNLLSAHTDVTGMGAVLQGIKEAGGSKSARVRMAPGGDEPSAQSPASWNPAGMTQDAAMGDVSKYVKGGPLPSWYPGSTPETQDAFRRRVLQGIKGAKG